MSDLRLDDPRIKKDVVRVIAQYLEDEGYVSVRPLLSPLRHLTRNSPLPTREHQPFAARSRTVALTLATAH